MATTVEQLEKLVGQEYAAEPVSRCILIHNIFPSQRHSG